MSMHACFMRCCETSRVGRIDRVPLDLVAALNDLVHVVLYDPFCVLFDIGSGFGGS
jgi:hypothetical protein